MSDTANGLSANVEEWTEEQKQKYFGVQDKTNTEDRNLASVDVPSVEHEGEALA